jgi:hypothetical protein
MDAPYRITLYDRDGSVIAEQQVDYNDDDDAIAGTARDVCPHEMRVWQGDRLVALFTYRSGLAARLSRPLSSNRSAI